ncbi:hypothetical protein OHA37_18140 [Streptomyces sp. NBC_00335]|uniref:hypothetical protein n=1 Tax=unclassified Streptomyces TaxID=2593676 RepID=UPI002256040A|nr:MULTISPECIES: hypothetical protein [unclassified Streptomyces]MCX5405802.1 hypothetical protein [Streptomyces sp. NBC_00086]
MTNTTRSTRSTPPVCDTTAPAGQRLLPVDWSGFPGRWAGGVSLVAGPLLLGAGVLLRLPFHFFYPEQLAARVEHPVLIAVSYGAFAAGTVLLWPAVAVLASRIGRRRPGLALWGGIFAVLGLFARTFHAGVDHLAFQLAERQGAGAAASFVGETYGAFHVFSALNLAVMGGWLLLAVGSWRAGVLGPVRALALAAASALPLGVLKGTTPLSVAAVAGLCLALVPLGVTVLRDGPAPRRAVVLRWAAAIAFTVLAMTLIGRAG